MAIATTTSNVVYTLGGTAATLADNGLVSLTIGTPYRETGTNVLGYSVHTESNGYLYGYPYQVATSDMPTSTTAWLVDPTVYLNYKTPMDTITISANVAPYNRAYLYTGVGGSMSHVGYPGRVSGETSNTYIITGTTNQQVAWNGINTTSNMITGISSRLEPVKLTATGEAGQRVSAKGSSYYSLTTASANQKLLSSTDTSYVTKTIGTSATHIPADIRVLNEVKYYQTRLSVHVRIKTNQQGWIHNGYLSATAFNLATKKGSASGTAQFVDGGATEIRIATVSISATAAESSTAVSSYLTPYVIFAFQGTRASQGVYEQIAYSASGAATMTALCR